MMRWRWGGVFVAVGGALTFVINAVFTPLLDAEAPYAETAASAAFMWRQGLSALAALSLLAGSVGLYQGKSSHSDRFGTLSFALAFSGTALLFAHEWSQVFFVHDLALRVPDVLERLDAAAGLTLPDIGALVALLTFTIGWISFSISLVRDKIFGRLGPGLVIGGFFATPLLSGTLPQPWGLVIGNAVLGLGWVLLGRELFSQPATG